MDVHISNRKCPRGYDDLCLWVLHAYIIDKIGEIHLVQLPIAVTAVLFPKGLLQKVS